MFKPTNNHQKIAQLKPRKRPICSHLQETTKHWKEPFLFFVISRSTVRIR